MSEYNCNCDASAGAPDHARTCPQHRDYGKISGTSQPKMNVKTKPQAPALSAVARQLVVEVEQLEAELYAAQDQVEGLQELMRTQRMPAHLDFAVRQLVNIADSDPDGAHAGSPQHCHEVRGYWDGDSKNAKGTLCEECGAWDALRWYAATDIAAEAQVLEPKPGDVWALPVDLVIELQTLPQADGHPKEALDKLGIRYETYWGNPLTGQVALLGCTNVPVTLPVWLKLRESPCPSN